MKRENHRIVGIHIGDRMQMASEVQKILTQYGCNIKTRVGLHEVDANYCAKGGVVLLEMVGDEGKCREMCDRLEAIDCIDVQQMVFAHE